MSSRGSGSGPLITTCVGVGLLVYLMPQSSAVDGPTVRYQSKSYHVPRGLVEHVELEPPQLAEPARAQPPLDRSRPQSVEAAEPDAAPVYMYRPPPSPDRSGCGADGECTVEALVRLHAVDNTVVVTFGNDRQRHFTENWVYHMQQLGVGGMLVGMMNMQPTQPTYVALATKLRAQGVGVYTVNSYEVKIQPQGGRWFHVLPLLRTGARLLLSDSDAVWLRNPLPYLRQLELAHPLLDFAVSTDAQDGTDARPLATAAEAVGGHSPHGGGGGDDGGAGGGGGGKRGRRRARRERRRAVWGAEGEGADLDIEDHKACWQSMNIGIMFFPPGKRPGTLRLLEEATTHLASEGNLHRVDQGPLNYRWKFGAGKWRWKRELYPARDASGARMCGLVNGTVVGGVLPSAQFCNTLTHSVLSLWRVHGVAPYVVHATWMRQQREEFKLMRLREAMLWRDEPGWYSADAHDPNVVGPSEPPNGFITYDETLPEELLAVPRIRRGAVPLHHYRLIHEQLKRLRNALFVARSLGRALVLPEALCSCELGFWPNMILEECKAADHGKIELPYVCPIDHYLDPPALRTSKFAHRERTFFDNPRTPRALHNNRVTVRVCEPNDAACGGGRTEAALPPLPSTAQLVEALGPLKVRVLHLSDAMRSFGRFDDAADATAYHREAQELLSSWCCTADERFKRIAGVVPYLLPPLPGQSHWLVDKGLVWAQQALAEAYAEANQTAMAAEIRTGQPAAEVRDGVGRKQSDAAHVWPAFARVGV